MTFSFMKRHDRDALHINCAACVDVSSEPLSSKGLVYVPTTAERIVTETMSQPKESSRFDPRGYVPTMVPPNEVSIPLAALKALLMAAGGSIILDEYDLTVPINGRVEYSRYLDKPTYQIRWVEE